jgi:hypothetical protein
MALPSWLDVSPAQFVQAREAGDRMRLERARLGQEGALESARIGMEGQRLAQAASAAASQLMLEKQRLAATEKQTMMENQLREETLKQNFLREQTNAALLNAYRQAEIGIAKGRLENESLRTALALKAEADRTATATAKPDPIALKQFDTLQAAYLNAVKESEKAANSSDPSVQATAANWRKDADTFKSRADELGKTIQGQRTPAGAAATMTGTTPAPTAPPNSNDINPPGLNVMGREANFYNPATGARWSMGPLAAARGDEPVTAPAPRDVMPLPDNKDDLEKGKWYKTSRGAAMWDGTNFTQP